MELYGIKMIVDVSYRSLYVLQGWTMIGQIKNLGWNKKSKQIFNVKWIRIFKILKFTIIQKFAFLQKVCKSSVRFF